MTPDLTYKRHGLFISFYAETPHGLNAWAQMAKQTDGTGKVIYWQLADVLKQLSDAGYSVEEAQA